jgi:hypothetical protein
MSDVIVCNLPRRTPMFTDFRNLKRKLLSIASVTLRLSAPDGKSGTSPMVSHDENSHDIVNDTKEEMIRESLQVYAAEFTRANREGFRPLAGLLHIVSKLGVKFVGELPRRNPLIICHDLVDIRINLRM